MKYLSQRLKDASGSLAESSITSGEGLRIFGLFKQLLHVSADDRDPPGAPDDRVARLDPPRRIGIWEPRLQGAEHRFVRAPEPTEPATLWANVRVIEPKGRRKRILLLGESVARGFFFDPQFNPAKVLQNALREMSGDRELEVVDLARTDLLLGPLQQLAAAAVQLDPDVVVVLAGNNWQPMNELTPHEFHDMAARLREGGWADVKRYLEELLRARVLSAIAGLARMAQAHRFPMVFVLPEFNLVDWRTDAIDPPLLTPPAMAQWHSHRLAAETALAAGALEDAEALGLQLLALDRGTTAAGSNIIADSKLRAGAAAEARKHLEAARDSGICWPRGPESPRCYSVIQETIRDESAKNRFALVDLPRIFQDHWQGGLPDRRMFMDYCHFTVEGTHVAMAAVAQVVLASLFRIHRPIREINRVKLPVNRKIEGEAHFLAAIHNGNWGQGPEIVRYHCQRAVELSSAVDRMMTLFLDFHMRRIPTSLCKSFDELCQLQNPSVISLLFDPTRPTPDKFLNPPLVEQVLGAIERQHPHLRSRTESLLAREHGVDERDVDLLSKSYSARSYHVSPDESEYAYHRADHRRSDFRLVCNRPLPVRLTLTYRTRHSGGRPIVVRVNEFPIGSLPTSNSWTTAGLVAPAEVLRAGINSLEIDWPTPEWDLATWKEQLADDLEVARIGGLVPIHGEIHTLRASGNPAGGEMSEQN